MFAHSGNIVIRFLQQLSAALDADFLFIYGSIDKLFKQAGMFCLNVAGLAFSLT